MCVGVREGSAGCRTRISSCRCLQKKFCCPYTSFLLLTPTTHNTRKPQGRTHYGKNFDRTYMHPRCPLRDNVADFAGLLKVREQYDPDHVFEPPLMTKVR